MNVNQLILLATCLEKPELQPGDALLAEALARRGGGVETAPWNGPFEPFARADLVVIRSTWDYARNVKAFRDFIAALRDRRIRTVNPPALMLWNLEKTYLLELGRKGAPLPATKLAPATRDGLLGAMSSLGLDEAVAKPVIGATASGLSILRRDDPAGLDAAAEKLGFDALVQPLIADIRTIGETSLIYFGGAFSHAVIKRPAGGSILVQEEHGGATRAAPPPAWAIGEGARILALLPERPVYARVDVVIHGGASLDGRLSLMEVELIEPELFLTHRPEAASRFADVLLNQLDAHGRHHAP
jgi:hypothetical protein